MNKQVVSAGFGFGLSAHPHLVTGRFLCRFLLVGLLLAGGGSVALAANYPIAAGASNSTVQSTINTAAAASGGNTVSFAAGSYTLSQITVPCPASPLVITGPTSGYPAHWNARPTAVINSAYTGEAPATFNFATPCSTGETLQYLEVNGGRPTSGGGAVYVGTQNMSNLTLQYNYFHGNQEIYPKVAGTGPYQYWVYDDTNANLIRLDGYFNGASSANTNSNITIEYNILGNPSAGDCSNVMQWVGGNIEATGNPSTPTALTFKGYDVTGGNCVGFGTVGNLTNLTFEYNVIQQQEQGTKGFECGSGTGTSNLCILTNNLYKYNDLSFIHRAFHETQQSPTNSSLPFVSQYNDMHDEVNPSFTNWFLSAPQLNYSVVADDLIISNTSNGQYMPPGYEWWGLASATNILAQGYNACPITFGYVTSSATIQNNIFEIASSSVSPCSVRLANGTTVTGVANEEGVAVSNYPTISGNSYTSTVSAMTSVAPTIAPAPQSFSGSEAVTLTDNGNVSGAGPRGNTGIWYTTDGSSPAPRSGTSTYCSSPCTLSLSTTTTVKAVGMWGAITQPASYPSGYGYVPSAVASATYTLSGTPSAAQPVLTPASETFTSTLSVGASSSTSGATLHCTTDGTTPTASSPAYTGPFTVTATTTIQCLAVASGYSTSAVGSGTYTLSTPTLTGGGQSNSGNVNTLAVGAAAVQQVADGNYSDGVGRTLPDTYGNTAVWGSSNTAVLNVTTAGLVSCLSAGTANSTVHSSPGGVTFSPWGWTCTTAPVTLSSVSLATTGGVSSIPISTTNQILATCHYSDGSTSSCNTADAHGNAVSMWSSSNTADVTISSSGLAGGAAIGSANLTATVAGLSSPGLPLTVTSTNTLVSAYLSAPGNTLTVGGTLQFAAKCHYSTGADQDCTVADIYGDKVTLWASNNTAAMTIQNVGGAAPGLATAVAAGSANAGAVINGSLGSSPWTVTISAAPVTLTGITLATTGGVTGIFVGQTNQIIATCLYSDGSTTRCNTADSHGNVAGSYASSASGSATVTATGGLITGVGAGVTNLTAHAGTFASPNLPVTVAMVPAGTYTIVISGIVRLTGSVTF